MPNSPLTPSTRLRSGLVREVIPMGGDVWDSVGPAWRGLFDATSESSAFLNPSWVETWLECFGVRAGAWAIVWRDGGGEPVGCLVLAPEVGRAGPFRVTRTHLNTPGFAVMPEHNDVLTRPEHRAAVLDDVVELLLDTGTDECMMDGVRDELFNELRSRWPGLASGSVRSESPYVDLARVRAAGGGYLGVLSSNTRSQIRRSMRLYARRYGDLVLEVAQGADQTLQWLADLVDLHEAVWQARGEGGAFGPDARRFHERLIERGRAERTDGGGDLEIEIARVRAGDHTIGMLYHLVCRGRVHFLQSGFRYEEDARLKPGLVSHCMSIEACLERGLAEYDFLGGEPRSVRYKRSLSTDARKLYWAQLPAPSVKMRVLEILRQSKHRFRVGGRATDEL